ncbi:hypothetical protein B0H19DRAFT_1256268 [Mycena capillaripes]|nr:hypothetical protein B0H19DRAFT_1274852 [Mycena capillaripes]KAJ6568508.1 hypothetical protein B0H19DRAFT_1256268 [Mycena capillaripes]
MSSNPKTASSIRNDDRLTAKENVHKNEKRARRLTEKEAQRRQEEAEAQQLKAAKTRKAAERQNVHDSESELDPTEREHEPAFSSQIVPSKPIETKAKALTHRLSKVPQASTKVFKEITNADQRSGRSDDREGTCSDRGEEEHYTRSDSRGQRGRTSSRSISPAGSVHDRSSSPSVGDKRRRSNSVDSVIAQTQAQKVNANGGRPKVGDYDDETQETAKEAIGAYRCFLSARNPFPPPVLSNEWAKEAWCYGQENAGTAVTLTPTLAKITTKRGSQFRGELKTKAAPVVISALKFQTGGNKKILKANRKKAEDLKEGNSFDPVAKTGLYQTFLIQLIANLMFFANKHDEGIKYFAYFNPFPVSAIALILTVIECCIDEWLTGVRVAIEFSEADYRSVYNNHLRDLIAFGDATKKYDLLEKIQIKIHNRGRHVSLLVLCYLSEIPHRFHAGVQPLSEVARAPAIGPAAFAAALKEYEEGETTDTDGEDGYLSSSDAIPPKVT